MAFAVASVFSRSAASFFARISATYAASCAGSERSSQRRTAVRCAGCCQVVDPESGSSSGNWPDGDCWEGETATSLNHNEIRFAAHRGDQAYVSPSLLWPVVKGGLLQEAMLESRNTRPPGQYVPPGGQIFEGPLKAPFEENLPPAPSEAVAGALKNQLKNASSCGWYV